MRLPSMISASTRCCAFEGWNVASSKARAARRPIIGIRVRERRLIGYAASPSRTHLIMPERTYDAIVAGAGIFGAWTSLLLRRTGRRVLLVDAYGPGNTRQSSGGETRIIRA